METEKDYVPAPETEKAIKEYADKVLDFMTSDEVLGLFGLSRDILQMEGWGNTVCQAEII
jgi:hypothetical protein